MADCGDRVTSMFSQAERDVDACSNWAGCRALQFEVIDGLTSDGVLLVVQDEKNLGDMLEPLNWGVRREEGGTDEEHEVLKWTELYYPCTRMNEIRSIIPI